MKNAYSIEIKYIDGKTETYHGVLIWEETEHYLHIVFVNKTEEFKDFKEKAISHAVIESYYVKGE